ncbi:hypothetical protein DS732_17095 [Escherichia coli]|uniref:Uncharacterized protein n=1 Tax=Escherichia coli TaxID=562 RepID=A0A346GKZ1_ECOLX|nr:hypothetical protein DS732_17095 [Escherichia coli]
MITPIFTGPFRNLKHRGYVYAQFLTVYENFSGKSMSVLLAHNCLFLLKSTTRNIRHHKAQKSCFFGVSCRNWFLIRN